MKKSITILFFTIFAMFLLSACYEAEVPNFTPTPMPTATPIGADVAFHNELESLAGHPEESAYEAYKTDIAALDEILEYAQQSHIKEIYTFISIEARIIGNSDTLVVYYVFFENGQVVPVLLVISGEITSYHTLPYESALFPYDKFIVADFNDDGKDEIVAALYKSTQGSSGSVSLFVYDYKNNELSPMVIGRYDYTGFSSTLLEEGNFTIANSDCFYYKAFSHLLPEELGSVYFDEYGKRAHTTLNIDLITDFIITDIDGDNKPELVLQHNFWQFAHAESFGTGYEVMVYNAEEGRFITKKAAFIEASSPKPETLETAVSTLFQ